MEVTNEVSPVTTFRFYPQSLRWQDEMDGKLASQEIMEINRFNDEYAELIGLERETVFFGNTKKQRLISATDTNRRLPVYAHKFFTISPYTTVDEVDRYVGFLKEHMELHLKTRELLFV